jgi:hypothetical protein
MHRVVPLVGLVMLVLLGGCGEVFDATSEEPAGVTPASVPTDGPLSDIPGLSATGITDPSTLTHAHAAALSNTSFTVRSTQTLTAANGTRLIDKTSVQRVRSDHRHWRTETTYNGMEAGFFQTPIEHTNSWFNGSHVFFQLQGPNGTEYRVFPGGINPTDRQRLFSYYLQAEATTVSLVNGTIRLHATIVSEHEQSAWQPRVNITERTITVTMTETGRVTQYRVEYTGRLAKAPATVVKGRRTVQFTALGETTVERPEWIATARNASVPKRR